MSQPVPFLEQTEDLLRLGTLSAKWRSLTALGGLFPLRRWLNEMEIRDRAIAHTICQLIPAQCPFERDVTLLGRTLFHIPPLCKLNPFYEEVVALRFRALCYLADECGEDVGCYV